MLTLGFPWSTNSFRSFTDRVAWTFLAANRVIPPAAQSSDGDYLAPYRNRLPALASRPQRTPLRLPAASFSCNRIPAPDEPHIL